MKNNIKNKFFFTLASFFITTVAFVPGARAQEITITGNGEGSSSSINISTNNTTEVQQTNTADINNNANTTADTGNNTADNNGGNTDITTGDATQTTNITNDVNTSVVDQTCCAAPTPTSAITVSGNGPDSDNNASVTSDTQTTISIIQNATITNTIIEKTNTGNNTAKNNEGKVFIQTGDIVSKKTIDNGSINSTHVSVTNNNNSNENTDIKIANNGEGSNNNVSFDTNNNLIISITNSANIRNNITSNLNTGNNHADGNKDDVIIRTGDIISQATIINNLNDDLLEIDRCKKDEIDDLDDDPDINPTKDHDPEPPPTIKPPDDLPPPPQKTDPKPQDGGHSDPPTQVGEVAAAVASILPATGNNLLFFALLGNIAMLFLGAYLRLRSGNAPGFALTF